MQGKTSVPRFLPRLRCTQGEVSPIQKQPRPSRVLCSRSQERPPLVSTQRGDYTDTRLRVCNMCACGSDCLASSRLLGADSLLRRMPRADQRRRLMPQTQPRHSSVQMGDCRQPRLRGSQSPRRGRLGPRCLKARELLTTSAEAFSVAASCPVTTRHGAATTAPGSSAAPGSKRRRCHLMKWSL